MKKLILTIMVAMVAVLTLSAQKPAFSIEDKSHDFGTIKESAGPVSCEFEFTNVGDAPLVILSAKASCGCTKPQYPREPVAPGKTGKIKVTYNPLGRPGEFVKDITVRTSDKKNKKVTLRITGTVVPKN